FGMAVAAGDRLSLVNALSTSSLACIASGRFGEVPPMLRQLRSIAGQDAESQLVADEVDAWLHLRAGSMGTDMYETAQALFGRLRIEFANRGMFDRESMAREGIASTHSAFGKYMLAVVAVDAAISRGWETGCWPNIHRLLLA